HSIESNIYIQGMDFKGSSGMKGSGGIRDSLGIRDSTGILGSANSSPNMSSQHIGLLNEEKITRVLNKIPDNYHKTDFAARRVALDYMRSTNRKDLLDQVEKWLDDLNEVTDDVVDVYFQGFNKSIHNYSRILQFMGDSHTNALSMSKEVDEVTKLVHFNNTNIERMWRRNLEYYYMIQILEKMEELKRVPGLLDQYLKDNHFVHASNLIVNSLQSLSEKDLVNVQALSELRHSLNERKEMFNELIIDRLSNHVYMRSLQTDQDDEDEDDFASILKKATKKPSSMAHSASSSSVNGTNNITGNNNNTTSLKTIKSSASREEQADNQPLQLELISKASNSLEDLSINPETNGKLFMNLLIESLNVLGEIDSAVGLILGKISIEMKTIISSCSSTVTQTYQYEGKTIAKVPGESNSGDLNEQSLMLLSDTFTRNTLLSNNTLNIPLVDLMNAIFKKVLSVFKNHMTLSIIVNDSIKKREAKRRRERVTDFSDDRDGDHLSRSMEESSEDGSLHGSGRRDVPNANVDSGPYSLSLVWEIMQKEIREMLRIHLQDTSSLFLRSSQSATATADQGRTTSVRLFSFSNSIVTDTWNGAAGSPPLSSQNGLMSTPLNNSGGISQSVGIFKASQYNVTPIYPLITQFTDHIDSLLSNESPEERNLYSSSEGQQHRGLLRLYIDDFVHRNFLEHIKSDYKRRVASAIEGTDAFKPLERSRFVYRLRETKPVLNGTLQIFQFITELFSDIVAMSHYAEEFGAIIQNTLLQYYLKCLSKFNHEVEPTITGALLNTDLFKHLLNTLDSKKQESADFRDTKEEEFEYKLEADLFAVPDKPVIKNQLILDVQKLTMIANLYHSLEWLAQRVTSLFSVTSGAGTSNTTSVPETPSKGLPKTAVKHQPPKNLLSPALTEILKSMDVSIKDITSRFRELAKQCLISLRIEYRIHCFYFLEGFKKTSYMCDEERTDPDSFIVELNKDLSTNEETMSNYLTSDKCHFLFGGIAKLIGKLLISKLVHIKQINNNGVAKLCKNVYTLQQNLTNIIVKREIFFDRIRQFYQSLANEDELLHYLLEKMSLPYFSAEEGRIILEFLGSTKRVSSNVLQTLDAKYRNM
ncbi:hypothetical protein SAMD00019534_016640, partial [Acytostelium subglobosum LB1]|uniref:hypothetical protein n=1 Tax=Acytostelium subglobosum LB1 TaxID=1410327 RepID=UPI000644E875